MSTRYFVLALLMNTVVLASASAVTVVFGTSDPWLAGMPDGSTASDGDTAPAQSPVLVTEILVTPGTVLEFAASGGVKHGPSLPLVGPDGNVSAFTQHFAGAEHGLSDVNAPFDSLLGVFLDEDQPTVSGAPAMLDFGTGGNVADGISYALLKPDLKQIFFIGDGLTDSDEQQYVIVPTGATRLFLGTMDGFGWFNNEGSFTVELPEPNVMTSLILGFLFLLVARRCHGSRLSQ